MHRLHQCRPIYMLLLVTSVVALSGFAAAQTWPPPQFVTSASLPIGASTNGTGTSAVLFSTGSGELQATVETSGRWSSPVVLTTATTIGLVAVAPAGDGLAVWSTSSGLQAAFYTAGHWGSPITLDTNSASSLTLNLGVDGHGIDTVVWEHRTSSACSLVAITGTAAAGFGSSQAIGAPCTGWANLAVNSSGQAIVAQGATTLEVAPILATTRASNGSWGSPLQIAKPYYGRQRPKVGLGNNGTAVAVWRARTFGEYVAEENGKWGTPAVLPQGTGSSYPNVAVDGNGNAVAAYLGRVSYRPAGGVFQTPVDLGNTAQVVASPAGTFMVTGSSVATLLPGTSTWNQNGPSSSLLAIAPGTALAIVSPLISVSTASVP